MGGGEGGDAPSGMGACERCTGECAALRASLPRIEHDLSKLRRRVKLNVGGVRFETSAATLAKYDDSYFGALFSGRFELCTDEDGSIFLDRNGALFAPILEFLRTGLAYMPHAATDAYPLLTELRYYLLEERFLSACASQSGAMSAYVPHHNPGRLSAAAAPVASGHNNQPAAGGAGAGAVVGAENSRDQGGVRPAGVSASALGLGGMGSVGAGGWYVGPGMSPSDYTRKEMQEKREMDVTMFAAYRLDGIDLSDLDLSRCTLARCRLRHADLRRTELGGANLTGAMLCGAAMQRAVLTDASLREADLSDVDLSNSICDSADFRGACLRGAVLRGSRLSRAILSHTDLSGRDLVLANLSDAKLTGADLRGADMRGCNLRGANLVQADLTGAILQDADLTSAKLNNAMLHNADLRGTGLRDASWELQGASLMGALLGDNVAASTADNSGSSGPPSPRAS